MIGVWAEAGLTVAACLVALIRRAAYLESRHGIRYTPRHAR
jgi:hypothetical protein